MSNLPTIRALALKKSGVFKLLVVLTAIVAWVISLGAGSYQLLGQLYQNWNLNQSNSLTVYLPPEADSISLNQLETTLPTITGVDKVSKLSDSQLQSWMQPLVNNAQSLPLPTVLTVNIEPDANSAEITQHIQQTFPTAEIDNHASLISHVETTVNSLQTAVIILSSIMLVILAILIIITVHTGLSIQFSTLHLLIQLGATNSFIIQAVMQQVSGRAIAGMLVGTIVSVAAISSTYIWAPTLSSSISISTWATVLFAPLCIPLLSALASAVTTWRILKNT